MPPLVDAHVHAESSRRGRATVTPPQRMRQVIEGVRDDAQRGGAVAVDLRFNPVRWRERGVSHEAQRTVLAAYAQPAVDSAVPRLRAWVTLKLDAGPDQWNEAVDFARSATAAGVVGIDASWAYDVTDAPVNISSRWRLRDLADVYAGARQVGLATAVHCGSYATVGELCTALKLLGAGRVGHAHPVLDEPGLVDMLLEHGATVEICPSAALRRQPAARCAALARHLLDAGVPCMLGTDHPQAFDTTLDRELQHLSSWLERPPDRVAAAFLASDDGGAAEHDDVPTPAERG